MLLADVDVEEAHRRLEETDGFVRPAIEVDLSVED
jgi:N-acetylmuramic acid 6-phosphate (MurNAc-6-P) etherase